MQGKQIVLLAGAVLAIVVAVVFLMRQSGPGPEQDDPMAVWVCDGCGEAARGPLAGGSADCAKCAEGQMVQRVYFRCKQCSKAFEGYQLNRSPAAPRAEAKCGEADKSGARSKGVTPDQTQLIRRPGGPWAWRHSTAGTRIARQLTCPQCGQVKYAHVEKVLDPGEP